MNLSIQRWADEHMNVLKYLFHIVVILVPCATMAFELKAGDRYCVGAGSNHCERIWNIKKAEPEDPEGIVIEELWRLFNPISAGTYVTHRNIDWPVFQVRVTSRYSFTDDLLCERGFLSSEFTYEKPHEFYYNSKGRKVYTTGVVETATQVSFLNWLGERQRCFQFGGSCQREVSVSPNTRREFEITYLNAYFYGNRDTNSKPWVDKENEGWLIDHRRVGDKIILKMPDNESENSIDLERLRTLGYLHWEAPERRLVRDFGLIRYDLCED